MEYDNTKEDSKQKTPSAKDFGTSIEVRKRSAAIGESQITGKLSRKRRQHLSSLLLYSLSQVAICSHHPMHTFSELEDINCPDSSAFPKEVRCLLRESTWLL